MTAIALSTFRRVSSSTGPVPPSTRETVETDTPARRATSLIDAELPPSFALAVDWMVRMHPCLVPPRRRRPRSGAGHRSPERATTRGSTVLVVGEPARTQVEAPGMEYRHHSGFAGAARSRVTHAVSVPLEARDMGAPHGRLCSLACMPRWRSWYWVVRCVDSAPAARAMERVGILVSLPETSVLPWRMISHQLLKPGSFCRGTEW